MPTTRVLLFFLRLPEPGKVKTRLAATMGAETAAAAYRLMVETLVERFGPGQDLRLIYTPDAPGTSEQLRSWLEPHLPEPRPSLSLVPQTGGDLGDRLTAAFSSPFEEGYRQVAVIGSDCLGITQSTLDEAWAQLEQQETDVVLGPATDGGYYLMALKQNSPTLFTQIPWSAENTLEVTLNRAAVAGLNVSQLTPLGDIDTEADWLDAARKHGLPARPTWFPVQVQEP